MIDLPLCPRCGRQMHSSLLWYVCPNGHGKFSSSSALTTSARYHYRMAFGKPSSRKTIDGMTFSHRPTEEELDEWEQWYLPPSWFPKDALILDVGARDGDTCKFFIDHGYSRFRLVEPSPVYHYDLEKNCQVLGKHGATIEIVKRQFELKDLDGVGFAKFDCEGCEYGFDIDSLSIPWAAEFHKRVKPDSNGVYPYVAATGYGRSR